jgi:hypothetical protein
MDVKWRRFLFPTWFGSLFLLITTICGGRGGFFLAQHFSLKSKYQSNK